MNTEASNRALIVDAGRAGALLSGWMSYAEKDWHNLPGEKGLGCYGAGYQSWGVQTNQKYLGAMAVLAAQGGAGVSRQKARDRALAALRFSMFSHQSGRGACTDGRKWGYGWISALGIERMMHGVYLLEPHLTDEDKAGLRAMITGEAEWLLTEYPMVAGVWNASKKNKPESNLWNGCLLWRAGAMYPEHPHAGDWQEKGIGYLINAVSVASDAASEAMVDGKMVKDRHVGANFFPNYALDHHGYLNVGYMVICVSNAGILHFDLKRRGLKAPEALKHHQRDLWQVLRRMIFADGRLARIGGDTRVRYAYCQEYLMPALMYAQEELGEKHAGTLAAGMLGMMETEAKHNEDGSYYGERLAWLRGENPYYHTRLESDRASVLGFALAYPVEQGGAGEQQGKDGFEASVAGGWIEPEHGAVMDRNPARLASFSWRAHDMMQGMCQPPGDGHLCDWEFNLSGLVEVAHHNIAKPTEPERKLLGSGVWRFDGGFGTIGAVSEGEGSGLMEGWGSPGGLRHALAYVALADGRTVVGIQLCRAGAGRRVLVRRAYGLGMALANDLYNGFVRSLTGEKGVMTFQARAQGTVVRHMQSRYVHLEGKAGLLALTKGDTFDVFRKTERQGGPFKSLYVERIAVQGFDQWRWFNAGEAVLDTSWAVVSGAKREELAKVIEGSHFTETTSEVGRVARVRGVDGREHVVRAEFGEKTLSLVYEVDGKILLDGTVETMAEGAAV
jgi:hypothetical protein